MQNYTLGAARVPIDVERTRSINARTALVQAIDSKIEACHPLSIAQIVNIVGRQSRRERTTPLLPTRKRFVPHAIFETETASVSPIDVKCPRRHGPMMGILSRFSPKGPVNAAVIIAICGAGQVWSGVAFAALRGSSPVPASFESTKGHRLNRGSDCRFKRARDY